MGADSLAENTPNAPEFICPTCLPKPKVLDINEKGLHWASVVRDYGCLKLQELLKNIFNAYFVLNTESKESKYVNKF